MWVPEGDGDTHPRTARTQACAAALFVIAKSREPPQCVKGAVGDRSSRESQPRVHLRSRGGASVPGTGLWLPGWGTTGSTCPAAGVLSE